MLALSPAEFGKLIAEKTEKWGSRAAKIKPEQCRSSPSQFSITLRSTNPVCAEVLETSDSKK
jgi:hypothetical protein